MAGDEGRRSRRTVLKGLAASVSLFCVGAGRRSEASAFGERLRALEQEAGGRLGVHLSAVAEGLSAGYRDDERFGMCSTFKLPLAALILRAADRGELSLDAVVSYTEEDMVPYAPVTKKHLEDGGMTIAALAEAAQTTSDNVAANLLLDLIGGPPGFTAALRSLGDPVTRLDRYETEMNLVPAGEVRDTTTPRAMAETVGRFFGTSQLTADGKATLRSWMQATRTGRRRLRAGFPADWAAGDKTGTAIGNGMPNKYNDVAVVWRSSPLVVAAYYEADGEYESMRPQDEDVLRRVGEIVAGQVL